MDKLVNKTVKLDLVGTDGNAYSIMGNFQKAARKQGWSKDVIDLVINESMSRDYNYLLATIQNHCE